MPYFPDCLYCFKDCEAVLMFSLIVNTIGSFYNVLDSIIVFGNDYSLIDLTVTILVLSCIIFIVCPWGGDSDD